MPDLKIPELTATSTLESAAQFPAAIGGANERWTAAEIGGLVRREVTGDDTVLVSDRGKLIDCIPGAGDMVLALPPVASLTDGWWCVVRNSTVTGDNVDLDPDADEEINGSDSSFNVRENDTGWLMCDGTAFYTAILSTAQIALDLLDVMGDVAVLQQQVLGEHASVDSEVTTTTLFSHTELTRVLPAGFQYFCRFFVFLLNDGAAEGVKFALVGSHALDTFGMAVQVTIFDDTLLTFATGRLTSFGASFGAALSAGANHAVIEGILDINETDDTAVTLQFAQNAAGGAAGVHVQVNSSAIFTKVAESS